MPQVNELSWLYTYIFFSVLFIFFFFVLHYILNFSLSTTRKFSIFSHFFFL